MADFGQTDFASVSGSVVWPTLAKTDFGQPDFDLWCCVVCCAWVLVSRFHGVGFHVWVLVSKFWFGVFGASRTALPGTALPLDCPKFRSFFLPATIFIFSSLFLVVFFSRGMLVVFLKARTLKCARLGFSGCRVKTPGGF